MKGLLPIILGVVGTFTFSWVGLTVIPNAQIGHLDPQMDEEGNDAYPAPKSGMAERGRQIFVGNGCVYCHSQQVRADYAASDIDRKWGERRSAPRDYLFERPVLLGRSRMGPDLANIGKRAPVEEETAASPAAPVATATLEPARLRAEGNLRPEGGPAPSPAPAAAPLNPQPSLSAVALAEAETLILPYSAAWHHRHLYSPRSITLDSNMPAYHFLYEKRRISGEVAADALKLTGKAAPPEGWQIVPSYDANCLVAYLMSLDQSHPLNEVKNLTAAAPGKAAAK